MVKSVGGRSSPRSLMNWMNSSNTKNVQKKMANRVNYLKFLAQNKNAYISDVAVLSDKSNE